VLGRRLGLISAALLFLAMTAPAGDRLPSDKQMATEVALDAAIPAAGALARPAKSCVLWTDWVSVCTAPYSYQRRGPAEPDEATCRRDALAAPRAASKPIVCLEFTGAGPPIPEAVQPGNSPYCAAWYNDAENCSRRKGQVRCFRTRGAVSKGPITFCSAWDTPRPFDGRNPYAMNHPWCRRWESSERICDRTPSGELRCEVRTSKLWTPPEKTNAFVCTQWNVPNSCLTWTDGTQVWGHKGVFESRGRRVLAAKIVRCTFRESRYRNLLEKQYNIFHHIRGG
jgi:hypothetical protein